MTNEKVYVMDFITKYNGLKSDTAKEAYLSSIVLEDVYTPYVSKMVTVDKLLQTAHIINDRVIFNTPKEYQLYIFTLIMLYTRLDVDGNTSEIFDELSKNELIDLLVAEIEKKNEDDYKTFNIVFKMAKDDFLMNFAKTNLDNEAIVNAVGTGIMQGMMSIMDSIKTAFEDPEIKEMFNEYLAQQKTNNASEEAVNKILSMSK